MLGLNNIYLGDCLDIMESVDDRSIDLILCDLPYGLTRNKWDKIIPLDRLWPQYERIIKDDGIIALTARQPFSSMLVVSRMSLFRYEWIWDKQKGTDGLNSSYKPLRRQEQILIFSKATIGSRSKNKIRYYPQNLVEINLRKVNSSNSKQREKHGYRKHGNSINSGKPYVRKYTNHPFDIIQFPVSENKLHPTQKPVELFEYLIKTYTKENDIVLDNCAGSGTTGIACKRTNRNFILIEKNKDYFKIAKERLDKYA